MPERETVSPGMMDSYTHKLRHRVLSSPKVKQDNIPAAGGKGLKSPTPAIDSWMKDREIGK